MFDGVWGVRLFDWIVFQVIGFFAVFSFLFVFVGVVVYVCRRFGIMKWFDVLFDVFCNFMGWFVVVFIVLVCLVVWLVV